MKANELRIGNFVIAVRCDKTEIEEKVMSVHYAGIVVTEFGWNEVKPIPINKEWLLKLGFEGNEHNKNYNLKDTIYVDLGNKEAPFCYIEVEGLDSINDFSVTHIIYVHQLQNLYFALTGEELNVKL